MAVKKKLIEVALPLEAINAESAREKSIRHGHPSTLHLWWARRPLATARAVIWSSLVDDPSSHPEQFPTEEAQKRERERLFGILTRLVKWENSNDEAILAEARAEIMKSTDNNPPALLDPFAGGGAIPLEAQRLGLEAHAHDLNPVAVMINKAMIEIPPKFANLRPVNPESRHQFGSSAAPKGAAGLAEDVRYYGELMKREAYKRIGYLYPNTKLKDGSEATVMAWIWARTVTCPNPACGCNLPLVKSFIISKKKGQEAYIEPIVNNREVAYCVKQGKTRDFGTVGRTGAKCICCGTSVPLSYIRDQGKQHKLSAQMMAVVVEGVNGRVYMTADADQLRYGQMRPDIPKEALGELAYYPGYINPTAYGFTNIEDLFTARQFAALSSFSESLEYLKGLIEKDAVAAGMPSTPLGLESTCNSAKAYAEAISVYLSFAIDKLADRCSSICGWDSSRDGMRNTFGLSGMSMSWDFAEVNPFSNSSGCFDNMLTWVEKCIVRFPSSSNGYVAQLDARKATGIPNLMISTDPPYYNNVPYADFSDFFYVWLRRNLRSVYPSFFGTMLTPKADELVADPYRLGGKDAAADFFERGMLEACVTMYKDARDDIPVTIYSLRQADGCPPCRAHGHAGQRAEHSQRQHSWSGNEPYSSGRCSAGRKHRHVQRCAEHAANFADVSVQQSFQ